MKFIGTVHAPTPGAYSQGVTVDPAEEVTLYLAGQTGNDPETGEVVEGGIVEQTRRCLENLKAVLRAAGGDVSSLVSVDVFIKDGPDRRGDRMSYDFAYRQFFEAHGRTPALKNMPARMQVWVAEVPWESEDTRIEIRGIAAVPRHPREASTHEL